MRNVEAMFETRRGRMSYNEGGLTPPARAEQPLGLRNTPQGYGVLAIALHWLVALVVIGLFILGVWMTGLTYYDEWYRRAPDIHKSIGILLFFVMLARVVWRASNVQPDDEPGISRLQRRLAHGAHRFLYALLFALMISGYFISTADGKPIQVFGLFAVPATVSDIPNQEDIAGAVHWYLALTLIAIVGLHAAAAVKHHFIDRDRTLKKMLGIRSQAT
jgi:cytochrome b561